MCVRVEGVSFPQTSNNKKRKRRPRRSKKAKRPSTVALPYTRPPQLPDYLVKQSAGECVLRAVNHAYGNELLTPAVLDTIAAWFETNVPQTFEPDRRALHNGWYSPGQGFWRTDIVHEALKDRGMQLARWPNKFAAARAAGRVMTDVINEEGDFILEIDYGLASPDVEGMIIHALSCSSRTGRILDANGPKNYPRTANGLKRALQRINRNDPKPKLRRVFRLLAIDEWNSIHAQTPGAPTDG